MQHPLQTKLSGTDFYPNILAIYRNLIRAPEPEKHTRKLCEYLTNPNHCWKVCPQHPCSVASSSPTYGPSEDCTLLCLIWPLDTTTLFFGPSASPDNQSTTHTLEKEPRRLAPVFVLQTKEGVVYDISSVNGGTLYITNPQLSQIPDFLCTTLPCGTAFLPEKEHSTAYTRAPAYDVNEWRANILFADTQSNLWHGSISLPFPHINIQYEHPTRGNPELRLVYSKRRFETTNEDIHHALQSLQTTFKQLQDLFTCLQHYMAQRGLETTQHSYDAVLPPSAACTSLTAYYTNEKERPVSLMLSISPITPEKGSPLSKVSVRVSLQGSQLHQQLASFEQALNSFELPLTNPLSSPGMHHFVHHTLGLFEKIRRAELLC